MTVKEILRGLKSIIEEKENGVVEMDIKTGLIYPTTMKLCSDDCKILLDYITNLQQENEKLKENQSGFTLEDYTRLLNNYQELQKEHKNCTRKHWQEKCGEHHAKELIYKSRCEKANNFIDNYDVFKEFSFPLMKRDIENQIKSSIDYEFTSTFRKELKNILNGSDENE